MTAADMWIAMEEQNHERGYWRQGPLEPVTLRAALRCPELGVEETIRGVCRQLDVSPELVRSSSRVAHVTYARMVCAWVLRQRPMSLTAIGKLLRRHHTTVMDGIERVETEREKDPVARAELDRIVENLASPSGQPRENGACDALSGEVGRCWSGRSDGELRTMAD